MANEKEQKLLDTIQKRLKLCVDADDHNRTAAIDDLRFLNGDQWDAGEKQRRSLSGRPALQINLLPKFVDETVGGMRENRPSIKFRPVDGRADINIAKIREGIVRNIEYLSNAPAIYDHAAEMQVSCGYGAWRVLTRYTEENPFLQEIYLESVKNPFLVYLDPSAKDSVGMDAKYGFILDKMSKDDFEDRYPGFKAPSDSLKSGKGLANELWYDKNTVTVAEYFVKETETVEMHQLEDGRVVDKEEYDRLCEEWDKSQDASMMKILNNPMAENPPPMPVEAAMQGGAPKPGVPPQNPGMAPQQQVPSPPQAGSQPPGPPQAPPQINSQMLQGMAPPPNKSPRPKIEKSRDTEKTVIKQYTVTLNDILDGGLKGNTVAGKFIPLVLVYGKERNIEGKRFIRGLVRDAKDPQKLINYWNTTAAETIALSPKAPWVGTAKQFEGYETDYANANTENFPFLKYNPDPDAPGPPQRQGPGQPPVAVFEQIRRGEENLRSVIGMMGAEQIAAGPERTGIAVSNKKRPGELSNMMFLENLARSVAMTGQIINEMIPEIYDTERDVRMRNLDDTESFVPVNTSAAEALRRIEENPERYYGMDKKRLMRAVQKYGPDAKFNELTVGKYDVIVTTGPSYTTQRQESAEALLRLTSTMPQQMASAADLIVRNLDFKDADEMADRLRKMLPPHLVKPREGEEPPKPQPPPPQVQIAQAKLQGEQMKGEMAKIKLQMEQVKLQREMADAQKPPEQTGPTPAEVQIKQMQMTMEKMRMDAEQTRLENQKQETLFKAQLEHERVKFEMQKQELAIQFQREMHELRMEEIAANVDAKKAETARKKKDPLKLRNDS